jgi:hypothetical protein
MYDNVPTTIECAAADIVDRYGSDAIPILRERADNAAELGDQMAAEEWRAIADTAENLTREDAGSGAAIFARAGVNL